MTNRKRLKKPIIRSFGGKNPVIVKPIVSGGRKSRARPRNPVGNKRALQDNLGHDGVMITAAQIIENSVKRVKRLEDIHKMQSYVHRGSDVLAFWSFLLTVLVGNFFASLLIMFLIIFLKSVFLLFVIFVLGMSLGFIYEKYLNGMHHLFLHHHLFSKVFLLSTAIVNVFYILSTSAYISNTFGLRFDSAYIILATSIYFISYLLPYAYVKFIHHHV